MKVRGNIKTIGSVGSVFIVYESLRVLLQLLKVWENFLIKGHS